MEAKPDGPRIVEARDNRSPDMKTLLLLPAAAAALLLLGSHPPEMESVVAADPPKAAAPAPRPAPEPRLIARGDYPPCTATRTDRCIQVRRHRGYRAPERRRIQLAMRAGERG
jgi:hypothetical protein